MAQLTGSRGMQDCFRLHPEMYASELEDDEDEVEEELRAREAVSARDESPVPSSESAKVAEPSQSDTIPAAESKSVEQPHRDSSSTTAINTQKTEDEGDELLPKAVHDARSK